MEIFKNYQHSTDDSLYNTSNIQKFVAHKFKKKLRVIRYNTLNIMIKMQIINGPRFIEALLVRSMLTKELFLMDIEQGSEINIPQELSQDHLPPSFRYYDQILLLIQEKLSQNRRVFSKIKIKLANIFDHKLSLQEAIGVGEFIRKLKNKKKSNIIKSQFSKYAVEEIDYNKSYHTKEVQRSNYIFIDDNREGVENNEKDESEFQVNLSQKTLKQILGLDKSHKIN